MKAVWYERNGPAREVLTYGEMPAPEPAAGEVLVRVHASGVNPSDWKTRAGSRPMAAPRVIPHSDGAGVIEKLGAGVDASRLGQPRVDLERPVEAALRYGGGVHRAALRAGRGDAGFAELRGRGLPGHPRADSAARGHDRRRRGGKIGAGRGRRGGRGALRDPVREAAGGVAGARDGQLRGEGRARARRGRGRDHRLPPRGRGDPREGADRRPGRGPRGGGGSLGQYRAAAGDPRAGRDLRRLRLGRARGAG
jgi:hypothetical protein